MNQWIQAHFPEGLILAALALVRWLLGREVRRIDKAQESYEARLRTLEQDRVTRKDVDELRMSLMASITHSGERIEDQVRTLTQHLLAKP